MITRTRLLLEAITTALTETGTYSIVASATNLAEAHESLVELEESPDAVLLHCRVTEGPAALSCLRDVTPVERIVAFGADDGNALLWAEAGAVVLLGEDAGVTELVTGIDTVVSGGAMCSPAVTAVLLRRLAMDFSPMDRERTRNLSPREIEVATLMSEGLSNKQIARRLNIQVTTVKNHVHSLLTKLEVSSRNQVRVPSRI